MYSLFDQLVGSLNWSVVDNGNNDNDFILKVLNVFNKLGFMFLSTNKIKELNGGIPTNTQVFIQYELNNFIFYTKSTLDSIAIILNAAYQLGFSKGDIDLKRINFTEVLFQKKSNSSVAGLIDSKRKWINEVVKWRDEMNHRTFNFVAQTSDPQVTNDHSYRMVRDPLNIMDHKNNQFVSKKYGGNSMQEILPFCESWMSNCKALVEELGKELNQDMSLFKK